ncbi:Hypothetical protein PHPALM_20787 [Phytophthora palmivora]|uniref:Uncharacterized protein n=1 Tax=Phytophthora palmivora TaxID=4796 RepID=A0A2P4XE02_9STRA|nr:Hypothetical protein PHPALM_20787 [Phytophthora palmivora]
MRQAIGGAMLRCQCASVPVDEISRSELIELRSQGQLYQLSSQHLYRSIKIDSFSSSGGRAHPIFSSK